MCEWEKTNKTKLNKLKKWKATIKRGFPFLNCSTITEVLAKVILTNKITVTTNTLPDKKTVVCAKPYCDNCNFIMLMSNFVLNKATEKRKRKMKSKQQN